jgi:hypothetical protein
MDLPLIASPIPEVCRTASEAFYHPEQAFPLDRWDRQMQILDISIVKAFKDCLNEFSL